MWLSRKRSATVVFPVAAKPVVTSTHDVTCGCPLGRVTAVVPHVCVGSALAVRCRT